MTTKIQAKKRKILMKMISESNISSSYNEKETKEIKLKGFSKMLTDFFEYFQKCRRISKNIQRRQRNRHDQIDKKFRKK